MVKAKHKEVVLHRDSALGETIPECELRVSPSCLNKGKADVQVITAGARTSSCWASSPPRAIPSLCCFVGRSTSILVSCPWLTLSQPCAALTSSRDINWDTSQWSAIIDDRSFLSWLVKVPSEAEQLRARQISMSQIAKLKEMWRENPMAKLEDAEAQTGEEEMQPILLR